MTAASVTRSAAPPLRLALVSEEQIPAEDLPTASPGSSAASPQPSISAGPNPGAASKLPAATVTYGNGDEEESSEGADEDENIPEPMASDLTPTPSMTPTPDLGSDANPAGANQALATGDAAPSAAPSEPPPALDLSASAPTPDLGAASLTPEIRNAASPARAASMRITEQARRELSRGAADVALRDLGHAVSIDGGNPFAYYYLGRAYLTRKNYAQALTFFQRAELGFAGRPDWRGETLSFEGACEEELGREPDAAKAYQQAVADAPGNFRARVGYGRLGASVAEPATLDEPPPDAE
ncbi:MAG: hypothetical protein ACREQT_03120, partial [Candidatus Binataceae bacterium]